jgi:hypothetical protein
LLSSAYEQLLTLLLFTRPNDSQAFTGLLLQAQKYLESHPDARCTIYQMSPNETRRRAVNEDNEIVNLYQGAYPVSPRERRGDIYPGDMHIHSADGLTIQLHTLTLHRDESDIATNVPTVAIWVPGQMARGWLVQDQSSTS